MNDKKIQEAIEREAERQLYNIELIASENYVSRDVLEAAGSILKINMQKAIRASVITEAVYMLMR